MIPVGIAHWVRMIHTSGRGRDQILVSDKGVEHTDTMLAVYVSFNTHAEGLYILCVIDIWPILKCG